MKLLLLLLLLAPHSRAGQTAGSHAAQQAAPKGPSLNFRAVPLESILVYHGAKLEYAAAIDKIAAIPAGERTFANTIKAYEEASARYSDRIQYLMFQKQVSADERIRNAADIIEDDANKFGVEMLQRPDLHRAAQEYSLVKESLSPEDERLRDFALRDLKNAGMGLPEDKRARLRQVQDRLAELSADFEANINKHKDQIEVTLEELKGLPEDFIAGLQKTAEGKYVVGLKYPEYIPFMTYADSGDRRRELSLKYSNRAAPKNLEVMAEALKLRDEQAKILGYADFPSWRLDNNRMAKNPETVMKFLNSLLPRLMEKGRAELAELLALKKKDKPEATEVDGHERAYYSEKLRRARYDFDPEEVKKYFPADGVIAGALKVYERVLKVKFEEIPNEGQTWHKDVRLYAVLDPATGRRLGHFYLDLFPRDNKYTHAAMFPLVMGRALENGNYNEPVAAVVANFPAPGADGAPALLRFDDVSTFFHEFGHAMHHLLTEAKYASLSGTNVPWDFVEAPSQMLENFIWDRGVLDEISGLPDDPAKKLPEDLRLKMLAASQAFTEGGALKGLHYLRQIAFATADMMLHATVPQNVSALFNMVMQTVGLAAPLPGSNSVASFGHLMAGYTAGYYSYLWAEVIEKDLFTPFRGNGGIFGPAGPRYRATVLANGNRRPIAEVIAEFLGRPYNDAAFLEAIFGPPPAPPAPPAS